MVLLDLSVKDCVLRVGEHTVPFMVFAPDEPYFRGRSLTNMLEYVKSAKALDRLSPKYRSNLQDLYEQKGMPISGGRMLEDKGESQVDPPTEPTLGYHDAKSTWVNEHGLYQLILGSEKPEAGHFKEWVVSEVLPTIRKTGSFALGVEEDERALMSVYKDQRVFYMGDIGTIDAGEHAKFGTTENINRRVSEHKRDFSKFRLKVVIPSDHHRAVEEAFKGHSTIKANKVRKTINDKVQTELIVLSESFTLKDAESIAKMLAIEQDIAGSTGTRRLVNLVLEDNNRAREKEQHALEMRKLDVEMRKMELDAEIRKMELETKKHELTSTEGLNQEHKAHAPQETDRWTYEQTGYNVDVVNDGEKTVFTYTVRRNSKQVQGKLGDSLTFLTSLPHFHICQKCPPFFLTPYEAAKHTRHSLQHEKGYTTAQCRKAVHTAVLKGGRVAPRL